tara:strand:- start:1992 stop:2417 length:426 start_codon:yes stop_codon:yes gene_type:complete
MKTLKEYIGGNEVKTGSPDSAEATSLMEQALARLNDLLALPLGENNASFRFESAYECVREALQSFMAKEGLKPYSHEAIFAYAKERELIGEGEMINLDRYRDKRNDINYRGEKINVEEAREIISFAKFMVSRLRKELEFRT